MHIIFIGNGYTVNFGCIEVMIPFTNTKYSIEELDFDHFVWQLYAIVKISSQIKRFAIQALISTVQFVWQYSVMGRFRLISTFLGRVQNFRSIS